MSEQLTLGEVIEYLEDAVNRHGTHYRWMGLDSPHSYRGYYEDLSFEVGNVTLGASLEDAKNALEYSHRGWKGGDFWMTLDTRTWLSPKGTTNGCAITRDLLQEMIVRGAPQLPLAVPPPAGKQYVVTGVIQVEFSIVVSAEDESEAINDVAGMSIAQIRLNGHVDNDGEIMESLLSATRNNA